MTLSLFSDEAPSPPQRDKVAEGATIFRGFALPDQTAIVAALRAITNAAPFRNMVTPGGYRMSVAMTNCGALGWITDRTGYRYQPMDPESGQPWPVMPPVFSSLAARAANEAGYPEFRPDGCLINQYEPGTKLSLHQDKDERDYTQPIVSVSLGIPAVFLFGGLKRSDKTQRIPLTHGDVVVWGGPSRLRYHGVMPLKEDIHPLFGNRRVNLTFRKAS